MDIDYPVLCPLMNEKIEEEICFDIHMVVDCGTPKWTAPEAAFRREDYAEACKNCQYHRDD